MRGSRQRRASPRFYCYSSLSCHQTVGTLLTGAYTTGSGLLATIFGTGTNGAYVEDQGALKKLSGNTAIPGDGRKMIINCEWGAFDNVVSFHKRQSSLPSKSAHSEKFSLCLNSTQSSIANPLIRMRVSFRVLSLCVLIRFSRKQAFEKMISGMYLGEIVRNILLYLIDQPPVHATATTPAQYHLFNGHSCQVLNTHYGLDTAFMSAIAEATSSEEAHALVVKTFEFEPSQITLADAEVHPNSFLYTSLFLHVRRSSNPSA